MNVERRDAFITHFNRFSVPASSARMQTSVRGRSLRHRGSAG